MLRMRIRSKKAGFRRCGIAHSSEWTEHPDGRFSDEEIERLVSEPMLQVEVFEEIEAVEVLSDFPHPGPLPQGEGAACGEGVVELVEASSEPKKPGRKGK